MSVIQLDAVNRLLIAKELVKTTDLDSGHPDVEAAKTLLDAHKKSLNNRKWWYNVEEGVTLYYNDIGYIKVPPYCVSLDNSDYTIMNGKLYDQTNRTNIFTDNVTELTLIFDREWDNMPMAAVDYVTALAKEEFIRPLGDQLLTQSARSDIQNAKVEFNMANFRFSDPAKQTQNPLMTKWREKMLVR